MPESSAPCRLAFLIRDLGHGGAQRQLATLARELAAQGGFQVTVVHFYPGVFEAELQDANVQTICVGKRHRWDLAGFFIRLVKTMHRLQPDVIHGYLNESNLMALFLKPLCGHPRIIWGIRDSQTDADTWGILGKLSFRLNCLLSSHVDHIIANSRAGRDYYIRQGYPAARFEVVPNGIDLNRFTGTSSGSSGSTFTLIGRLHPMKDHTTFLRALAQVPEAKGRIIGRGDAIYEQDMQALAARLNLQDRLIWETVRDDLPALYPTLDCVVSTSAYGEGFSNVLGEAMACALPCIASDVGDSAWLLNDPTWIFPAGDAMSLAEKMRTFLTIAPEGRHCLGITNRRRILEHFTVQHMIERTAALIRPSFGGSDDSKKREGETIKSNTTAVSALANVDTAQPPPTSILWITTGLGTGGAEMMLAQLIGGLTGYAHTVISLTAGGKYVESLKALGAKVHSLDMPAGKPTLKALWRLLKVTYQTKPHILMGWMYHGCLATSLIRLVTPAPMIWNIRQSLYDLSLEKRGSALVIRGLAWLSRLPKTITYNSEVSARQHESIGYKKTKTYLIPNGFDLTKWQGIEQTSKLCSPQILQREKIRNSLCIGRIGRYTTMKDYPTFLEAASIIVKEQPQVQFILVGTGVTSDNTELTGLITRLNLTKHVHLLGERHDLPALTASLDIAVSSSAFGEGFPNVVGEAMACGVPVVATDIGDTAWVMGDTGRLVPPKNPATLAAACLDILRLPPEERRILGHEGRERIQQHFSLASVTAKFNQLLSASLITEN